MIIAQSIVEDLPLISADSEIRKYKTAIIW
jgi:PIN domain nuclease of toxin-antitoxin system